jgi:8-oxo-dGTP pyrophosphatase MutT (NUDIX family)
MSETKNPWTKLAEKQVYDNPWITVAEHQVLNPKGGKGIYGMVHFKNLAIGIIPIDSDGNTRLVGQYRYPLKQYSWEIPEGGGKKGTDPLDSAKRELLEETGLKAQKWTEIQRMHLSNSVSDELAIIYLAEELSQHEAAPEDTEELIVKTIPFDKVVEMVMNGEITDSLTVAAVLKLKLLRGQ